jgi:DNA repair exonuclease SbcCD nuclease subunit
MGRLKKRIALMGDTHWGVRNDHPAFLDNMRKSSEWMLQTLRQQYADVNDIIHLGDLYDRRKYVNFQTAELCHKHFLQPVSHDYRLHIITGNHDVYYKDTYEVNALKTLVANRYPTIRSYSTATDVTIQGTSILLVPWICEANKQHTQNMIDNTCAQIMMGHLELTGFEMYKNVIMQHGDDPNVYSKFQGVYSGHFHRKSTKGNINYIGAFGEYTWSDHDCPRGFSILDLDTLELEFVKNPFSMFRLCKYDDTNYKPGMLKNLDFSKYADSYVKVVVVTRNDPFVFDMFMDKLYAVNPIDVSIVEVVSTFVDNAEDEVIDEAQDTPSILDGYISGLTLPIETDRMKKYMRSIYKEAITINEDLK